MSTVEVSTPLSKGWDDVLGKRPPSGASPPPTHRPLIEEPGEAALAAERLQRVELGLELVRGSRERVFGLAHPLDRRHKRGVLLASQHSWMQTGERTWSCTR